MSAVIYCNNPSHPCIPKLKNLVEELIKKDVHIELVTKGLEEKKAKLCFLVSCTEKIRKETILNFQKMFVLHASDLPKGRGWSPYIWEILQGVNEITVSLIEADDKIDTGDIWLQKRVKLKGNELLDEILSRLIDVEVELIKDCINRFEKIQPREQTEIGVSYYKKRNPEDSRLDVDKTIREQFNLLRVVDNQRFPAFFEIDGSKYLVKIFRE
jgi:methionyl-tRNA formyltransferase